MRRLSALCGALFLSAALAGPAAAIRPGVPVDLTGDLLETVTSECRFTGRGAAEALQGDSRLRADTITVFKRRVNGKCVDEVARVEATGGVYYVTPTRRVRGDAALYEASTDLLVVTGDVTAVEGKNVFHGARLVVRVQTGDMQMQSGGRERARGVFYPKQRLMDEPEQRAERGSP